MMKDNKIISLDATLDSIEIKESIKEFLKAVDNNEVTAYYLCWETTAKTADRFIANHRSLAMFSAFINHTLYNLVDSDSDKI